MAAKKQSRPQFDGDLAQRRLLARYDAAKRTPENANLWIDVDALSAAAANDPKTRKTLRERARYERANNTYCKAMIRAVANEIIGPEVQIQLGDTDLAEQAEYDFSKWARKVKLWSKLRTVCSAKITDGEAFGMMVTNPKVNHDIKLDLALIECDRIESWYTMVNKENEIDGIKFDDHGNPIAYRVLKTHPGDHRTLKDTGKGEWISRDFMFHYFAIERPEQVRGVSEITPALNLFGQLRRYTSSVIESAQRAAEISAIMYTDLLPEGIAAELSDPITIIEAERNAIMSLPEGWKLSQLKPEQPANTYKDFKAEIIKEIARTLNLPEAIASGSSAGYNYASGRLDFQAFDRMVDIERDDLIDEILDRLWAAWLEEYKARRGLSDEQVAELEDHEWLFVRRGHVDPNKEASADDTRFANGTLTKAAYYAQYGKDSKQEFKQLVAERIDQEKEWDEARKSAGLPPAPFPWSSVKEASQQPAPDKPNPDKEPNNDNQKPED
jgi:lambda family phage portal protein